MKKNKKSLIRALIAAGIVLSLAVGSTVAYIYFETAKKENSFSVGSLKVEIIEPGVDPDSVEWGADTKPVQLRVPTGEGAVPCVVRAMIVPTVTHENGQLLLGSVSAVSAAPVANRSVLGDITLCFDEDWSDNWFYKDGYFYYKKVVKPGETTPELLKGVILTEDTTEMREKYHGSKVNIDVIADALQASHSAPGEWGLTVDGAGNVS